MVDYQDELELDPVEEVAEEFLERYRLGERPSVEEFVQRYPDLATEIRELLPTIAAMERIKVAHEDLAPTPHISRLGDFRIVGEIGRGGMGIVYEAIQESLDRRVAVKVLPQSSLLDERRLQRFEREARTAAQLHHTNIVPVLGVGEFEGMHYYVMQYIRGVGLDEVMSAYAAENKAADNKTPSSKTSGSGTNATPPHYSSPRSSIASDVARALLDGKFMDAECEPNITVMPNDASGTDSAIDETMADTTIQAARAFRGDGAKSVVPLDLFGKNYWRSVANLGRQVADALHYAHSMGVLHRDIKPANLLLDRTGVVWVADFGLAKAMEHDNVSRTGDIVGTLRYMAPEQLRNEADSRSDIFSLGITLYELITLRQAFTDTERKQAYLSQTLGVTPTLPRKINPRIPRDLETIVLKAMAVDPAERYQDAGLLVEDLIRFSEDRPISARRVPLSERAWRWCRRNPAVASLSVVVAMLMIVAAGALTYAYVEATGAVAREAALRTQTEGMLEDTLKGLDDVYNQFAPNRPWDSVGLTYENEDGEAVEVQVDPALDERTVAVLMKVLNVYDRLAEKNGDNDRLAASAADATRRVGDIQARLGQRDEAVASYKKATERFTKLTDGQQDSKEYEIEVARTFNRLAVLYSSSRERQTRMEYHQSATEALRVLNKKYPQFSAAKFELAKTFYLMGRQQSIDWQPFVEMNPARRFGPGGMLNPDLLREMAGRLGFPGGGERGGRGGPPRGGPPGFSGGNENRRHLTTAIDWLDKIEEGGNSTDESNYLRALCLRDLTTRFDDEFRSDAIRILRDLADAHPAKLEYQLELSETLAQINPWAIQALNDTPERDQLETQIRSDLIEAGELARKLADEHPGIPEYMAAYARRELRLARVLEEAYYRQETRDPALATEIEARYREASKAQRETADQFSLVSAYRFWAIEMEAGLARWLNQTNRPNEAIEVFERALHDVGAIEEFDEERRPLADALSRLLRDLARTYAQTGDENGEIIASNMSRQLASQAFRGEFGRGPDDRRGPDSRRGPDGGRPGGRNRGPGGRGGPGGPGGGPRGPGR
jgi:serine/threonine protein kinase